jgi:hypothetical protein
MPLGRGFCNVIEETTNRSRSISKSMEQSGVWEHHDVLRGGHQARLTGAHRTPRRTP